MRRRSPPPTARPPRSAGGAGARRGPAAPRRAGSWRRVFGSAFARSPSRARSLSQASKVAAISEAASHAELIANDSDGKWPIPQSLPARILLRGHKPDTRDVPLGLARSAVDRVRVGVPQVWCNDDMACHWRRAVVLSWAMSSRLAARAAVRSSSRCSSWSRRSMACCSRRVIFWQRASMSAGVPSPDSRQACSPSASDRRFSSCRMRAVSRAARSWAASRSACREAG